MPSDTWIIFLKFWRNLCFPPSVHFWCWAVSGFPTLLPVTKKKPQKFSKAEFAQRAAIPSLESAGLPCQQQVQGSKLGLQISVPATQVQLFTSTTQTPRPMPDSPQEHISRFNTCFQMVSCELLNAAECLKHPSENNYSALSSCLSSYRWSRWLLPHYCKGGNQGQEIK